MQSSKTMWTSTGYVFLLVAAVAGTFGTELPLRLVGVQIAEFFRYRPDGKGSVDITERGGEFLKWIARYAKFKYQPVDKDAFMADIQILLKNEQNRTIRTHNDLTGWDGLLLADLVIAPLIITSDYFKLGDTVPLFGAHTYMLIPYPQEEQKMWAFVNPFTPAVWACIACAALFLGGVLHVFNRLWSGSKSFPGPYMYVLQVTLGQGGIVPTTKLHYRLVALSWCLAALILSNVYLSLVVTAFSAPFRKPLAETMQEFIDTDLLPVLIKQSYPYELFKSSTPGSMLRELYDRSMDDTNCNYADAENCASIVTDRYYAGSFVTNEDTPPLSLYSYIETGKCNVAPFVTDIPDSYLTWYVVRKNHSHAHSIKIAALRAVEYGLPKKFSSTPSIDRFGCPCCNWKQDRIPLSKLTMKDLMSVFIILTVGYFIASVVFVIEVVKGRRQSQKKRSAKNTI